MADQGVRRGQRVVLLLGQRLVSWVSLLALLKVGAVTVPLYTSLPRDQVADRLLRGEVDHVIVEPAARSRVRPDDVPGLRVVVGAAPGEEDGWLPLPAPRTGEHRPFVPDGPTPAGDLAYVYFTSGSTAAPKMVGHTHASLPDRAPQQRVLERAPARHQARQRLGARLGEALLEQASSCRGPPRPSLVAAIEPVPAERLPRFLARTAATSLCAPASTWSALTPPPRPGAGPARRGHQCGGVCLAAGGRGSAPRLGRGRP
ncbi:class I adenylate-forming enzyme family protein [Nocardioides convexus]|uniref:class I adenylate-forming enzyme family protein n=1 Tax=Nocardioides convexus TaxID=2712224 RepID=UPI00241877DE|nr:class I adenylate-forming enzyme family protein [Nocardioides convexus]